MFTFQLTFCIEVSESFDWDIRIEGKLTDLKNNKLLMAFLISLTRQLLYPELLTAWNHLSFVLEILMKFFILYKQQERANSMIQKV
jgi:hypothetical protein